MNKYLHLGTLVAALTAGGCYHTALPDTPVYPDEPVKEVTQQPKEEVKWPSVCDKIDLKDGEYNAGTPVLPATYYVYENAAKCMLDLKNKNTDTYTTYIDVGCDNTMDAVNIGDFFLVREQLGRESDVSIFDQTLSLGQMFVCKENRIKTYME